VEVEPFTSPPTILPPSRAAVTATDIAIAMPPSSPQIVVPQPQHVALSEGNWRKKRKYGRQIRVKQICPDISAGASTEQSGISRKERRHRSWTEDMVSNC
jgi:hypothetical protein